MSDHLLCKCKLYESKLVCMDVLKDHIESYVFSNRTFIVVQCLVKPDITSSEVYLSRLGEIYLKRTVILIWAHFYLCIYFSSIFPTAHF